MTVHNSNDSCTTVGSECSGEMLFAYLVLMKLSIFSSQHLIIISERDMFDYSSGEPDPNMLTVLRALEVGTLLFALLGIF